MADIALAAGRLAQAPLRNAEAAPGSQLGLIECARRTREAIAMARLSDAELADLGLTRDEIVARAFGLKD